MTSFSMDMMAQCGVCIISGSHLFLRNELKTFSHTVAHIFFTPACFYSFSILLSSSLSPPQGFSILTLLTELGNCFMWETTLLIVGCWQHLCLLSTRSCDKQPEHLSRICTTQSYDKQPEYLSRICQISSGGKNLSQLRITNLNLGIFLPTAIASYVNHSHGTSPLWVTILTFEYL